MNANLKIDFIDNIDEINANHWHNLNNSPCPFLRYDFFKALESSQSANSKQGWQPHHLIAKTKNETMAVMPMYLKNHSWGEYVFDWDWAEAFKRYNVNYYPKLVATIPFTPVSSSKLLSSKVGMNELFTPLTEHCQQEAINSWHILFCDEIESDLPEDIYHRNTVQFHWFNQNYNSFDDYLSSFTSRKRKNTSKVFFLLREVNELR